MKRLSTNELRQGFLDYFQDQDHAIIPGASLIPENDPTVLFTTAGMHPLVPYLMGEPHPAGKRLADVQRCIRTLDIDEVGDTYHLTMFEMLGNWSLGDYFKEESIAMSYEFLTKVLGIPHAMLAVTCFAGNENAPRDEEAAKHWSSIGIAEERIGFLIQNNWWGPAGATGPCGPDSEIFYWVGEGKPRGNPETLDSEWMEIWNNVFMQYNKSAEGKYEPLEHPCVDTGMGLERTARIMQGVDNVYEIDSLLAILQTVLAHSTVEDCADKIRHSRIITDHIRAATFIIGDGVAPSNVDQGYVLRKLIRRAIRSARQLGIEATGTFTPAIAEKVIQVFGHAYGHLESHAKMIRDAFSHEETQFGKTLHEGMKQFEKAVMSLPGKKIAGTTAFHLYDTYGFPMELTREIAKEQGLTIDEEGFAIAFEAHQNTSRAGAEKRFAGGLADHSAETTKLHTATHLLNAALRKVLGPHVQQRGSNITARRLRFDFSHEQKMTPEQVKEAEDLVNGAIQKDLPVHYHVTSVENAKNEGAIGVFDDRYAKEVKVYQIGPSTGSGQGEWSRPFSLEICGGPHVAHTGMIGQFKIQKEESSSAGVRRIKATVSGGPGEIEMASERKEVG